MPARSSWGEDPERGLKAMASGRAQGLYSGLGAREGSAWGEGNIAGRLLAMDSLRPLSGGRVIDVGCGNGAYTLRIAERFVETVGVDLEPDRVSDFRKVAAAAAPRLAAEGRSVHVRLGSASALPYADAHFDVVTAIETMEHLGAQMDAVLQEVARTIRPGGSFYLTTPNRWWPLEQHGFRVREKWRPGWQFPFLTWIPAIHRRFSRNDAFTPQRLDRIVTPHGFRRTGLAFMFPPLDGHPQAQRATRPVVALLVRTPLRHFAQTLVMTYERIDLPL